nr:tRNA pseudouridine(55) synthase TruB [Phaeovibrio sulfidiphilus]
MPVSGWLNVDKPLGMSSAHVVAVARRVLNAAKVGHGGTLDPFASGVLPLAFGEATKTVPWVMDGEKTYAFTVRWGEARDTDDQEGVVVATSDVRPDVAAIEAVLPRFVGDIVQVPPAYSAVKVDGRRAYDLARADVEVSLKPRTVRVHAFELVDIPGPDEASFHVVAGKGTYVRSLARDLAAALGTCGYVSALRRLSCGPFRAADAIPLDILRTLEQDTAALRLLPVEAALDDIPVVPLTEEEARRLSQGQALSLMSIQDRSGGEPLSEGETVQALLDGRIVALAQVSRGALRSLRGFVS